MKIIPVEVEFDSKYFNFRILPELRTTESAPPLALAITSDPVGVNDPLRNIEFCQLGILNVVEPSPIPNVVPIIANNTEYVLLEIALPSADIYS